MTKDEKFHIVMICLMETISCSLANMTKPKTRRWNQYMALIDRLGKIDKTYHGALNDDEIKQAEDLYAKIEQMISEVKI